MSSKSITPEDIQNLERILKRSILYGTNINDDFSHDELQSVRAMPEILIKAESSDEIPLIAAYANENNIPLYVRGAGTGLVGSSVATKGGIMIDMSGLNRIIELDEENLTLTVEPGITLMELNEFLDGTGYMYPPDPGEKTATIGGNISTNAGGMRAVKYGVTRDYVRSIDIVMIDGTKMTLGGKTVKFSSGYSIKDLIIGSEGTLAIITKAILKIIPAPSFSQSFLIPFRTAEEALCCVPLILKSRLSPTAVEFMTDTAIEHSEGYLGKKFPNAGYKAYLLLTFDGNDRNSIESELSECFKLAIEQGAIDAYYIDTDERKKTVWSARGAFLEAIKASTTEMDECDVVVPKSMIAEFVKETFRLEEKTRMRLPSFGHAGDGNLHIYLCRDDMDSEKWENTKTYVFDILYAKAAELGGFVSGEHGIGWAKKEYLRKQLGDEQIALLRRIKKAFDPKMLLNPDKIFNA